MLNVHSLNTLYRRLRTHLSNASQTNPSYLDRLPADVTFLILDLLPTGDLKSLSSTNRHLRRLASARLFQSIHLGPSLSLTRLRRALFSLQACHAVGEYARTLRIGTWSTPQYRALDATFEKTVKALARFLVAKLTNLKSLEIDIQDNHATKLLQKAFEDVSLPHVTSLTLSPHVYWMMAHCPAAKSIINTDSGRIHRRHPHETVTLFSRKARHLSQLQHLSLPCLWSFDTLQPIVLHLPRLKSLRLAGHLDVAKVHLFLPLLRRLECLERLEVLRADMLENHARTLDSVPSRLLQSLEIEPRSSWRLEMATRVVLARMPTLRVLRMGNLFQVWQAGRSEDGSVEGDVRVHLASCMVQSYSYRLGPSCRCPKRMFLWDASTMSDFMQEAKAAERSLDLADDEDFLESEYDEELMALQLEMAI